MEYTKSDITYLPLHEEVSAKIQVATEIVGDLPSDEDANLYVNQLNVELYEAKLIGEPVHLMSSWIVWSAEDIENGEVVIKPVLDTELLKKRAVDGTFVGVDNMEVDGQRMLIYRLSVGFDDRTGAHLTVASPVEESMLLVGTEGSREARITRTIEESLRKLNTIEDIEFRDSLREFMDLLQEGEMLSATLVQEIGIMATWLMAHDQVKDSKEMLSAIGKIIKVIMDDDGIYHIAGLEIIPNLEDKTSTVRAYDSKVGIYGVGTVDDFDFNSLNDVDFHDTVQPVIIVVDESDDLHYIPLRFVTEYVEVSEDPEDPCRLSMRRFLNAYPNIMKVTNTNTEEQAE